MIKTREENRIIEIPAIEIRPNKSQPRKIFEEEELKSLADSIAGNGLLQPLTVRKIKDGEYELVAGERRLRASVMAGLQKIPCIVIRCSDKESAIFALVENLQRKNLGMFEEAQGIERLMRKHKLTQEQVALYLGKKQSTIANKLRLLKLTYEEQDWIIQAGLSERHARALLKIGDHRLRRTALSKMVAESMNARQAENYVDDLLAEKPKQRKKTNFIIAKDVRIFINTINKAIDVMKLSGIKAESENRETEEYLEYIVKIPKTSAKPSQKREKAV
ncbi:MAG: ParB/RepB/Spo0J family partition protein [Acutalibacteraceae bacterium]